MRIQTIRHSLLIGTICGSVIASSPARAQTDDAPETTDIVVTAQNRQERLQEVPIQISAFTQQAITDADIGATVDVVAQIPNVTFDRGNTYRSSYITMRGLTQIANADPPIAFVLDGVPQTNSETIGIALYDIERIEVLKGPQGALYGRNAVGGAINVITKEPGNDLEGFFNGSYSSGRTIDVSSGVSGPLIDDKLLFRVAATYKRSDGLILNPYRGDNADYIDHDVSFRGRLLIKPTDWLKIDLRAEHGDFTAGSNYYSLVESGDANDYQSPTANLPGFTSGKNTDLTAKMDIDLDFATFSSITNHTDYSQLNRLDVDFSNPVDLPGGFMGSGFQFGGGQDLKLKTTSQELRLISSSAQNFRWLVGGYYLHTNRALRSRLFIDLDGSFVQIENPALRVAENSERNSNDAYAAFAQFDYDILPNLTLTGGLRYDRDDRKQTDPVTGDAREASFDHIQPKVTLTWKPGDDKLLYATFSTGFRSGGFNPPNSPAQAFDQETLRNYEVGFKSQFFDKRLTLNGAVFMTDVQGYQYFYVDVATASQVITNIDKVRIKGLELEAQATLFDGLDASVGIGVTDTEIRKSAFPAEIGKYTPRTIPFSSNASLQYRRGLGGGVDGFARIEWRHLGRKYWTPNNIAFQKPIDLVNARIGVEIEGLGIYGFVQNLLKEEYYSEFFDPAYSGADSFFGYRGAPRVWGVELKAKF